MNYTVNALVKGTKVMGLFFFRSRVGGGSIQLRQLAFPLPQMPHLSSAAVKGVALNTLPPLQFYRRIAANKASLIWEMRVSSSKVYR